MPGEIERSSAAPRTRAQLRDAGFATADEADGKTRKRARRLGEVIHAFPREETPRVNDALRRLRPVLLWQRLRIVDAVGNHFDWRRSPVERAQPRGGGVGIRDERRRSLHDRAFALRGLLAAVWRRGVGEHLVRLVSELQPGKAPEQRFRDLQMPRHYRAGPVFPDAARQTRGEQTIGMHAVERPGEAARHGQEAHVDRPDYGVGGEGIV